MYLCSMSEFDSQTLVYWILPATALFTALATLAYARTVSKQYKWDKAPIIRIDYNVSEEALKKGSNIWNDPAETEELKKWNIKGGKSRFIIAKVGNEQKDAMGVAARIEFWTQVMFNHPTAEKKRIKETFHFYDLHVLPGEEFPVVITNISGLDYLSVDITKIRYYDIRGVKHSECHGYCAFVKEEGKRGTAEYRCIK